MYAPRLAALLVLALLLPALAGCVVRVGDRQQDDPFRRDAEIPPALRDAEGWPPLEDAILRPGSVVYGPPERHDGQVARQQCTANFLFSDPTNESLYLGTGSHCVSGARLGDTVLLADGRAEGTIAYCSFGTAIGSDTCPDVSETPQEDRLDDFALIRIRDEDRPFAHPAVLVTGGPTGWGERPERGDGVFLYGNSRLREDPDEGTTDEDDVRAGRVWQRHDATLYLAFSEPVVRGDSGSPVLATDGGALAVMQFKGELRRCDGEADIHGAGGLAAAVERMESATDLRVVLHTWPLLRNVTAPPMPENVCEA